MDSTRVLIAKPGLDGHDRGARIVVKALRDAGMEVIYLGIRQTPQQIAAAAIQEDVHVVGLSVLSGAHVNVAKKVMNALREAGVDVPVVIGGTIPRKDIQRLREVGLAAVLPTSTPIAEALEAIRTAARQGEARRK